MTCAPLLVLAVLECGLRLAGYGYDPAFLRRIRVNGQDCFVPNEEFSYRFFPPAIARSIEPFQISVVKPANAYRIFLFGESAANGDPDSTYGMGRYLEVLLRERFPGTSFQVVCVAMTASDSHVILPIARACASHDGDLWLFYMGNNEMVGPFGAETSYGLRAPGRGVVRAVLALKTLRTGQLLDDLLGRFRGASTPRSWGGMQMFTNNRAAYDAPARLRAYSNFKANLEDILGVAHAADVPVILSTVAVNLKDSPPFASMHETALGDKEQIQWNEAFHSGTALESNKSFAEAVTAYARAELIDPHYSEVFYRKAWCELALSNRDEAQRDFELARDYDALSFRADSRINGAIADAASRHSRDGVHFMDGVGLLGHRAEEGIPGLDLFYEHVHLNFSGNYALALGFAEATWKFLPASVTNRDRGDWCSEEECDRRLAVTVWDRGRVWQPILTRIGAPPFTGQQDRGGVMKKYDVALAKVGAQMDTQSPEQARQMYEAAIAMAPDDYFLHGNFERFLEAGGFLAQAVVEAKRCCELVPQLPGGYFYVGKLLAQEGNVSEAEQYFEKALTVRKNYAEALNGLGEIRANQGRKSEAENLFQQAIRANPRWVDPYLNIGFLQQNAGDLQNALKNYAKAAALEPEGPADYFNRAAMAASRFQWEDAMACWRGVVKAKPDFWQARYQLGLQLAAKGAVEEAGQQLEVAVRCRPDFIPARLSFAAVLVSQGRLDLAEAQYGAVLKLDESNADARRQIEAIQAQKRHANGAKTEVEQQSSKSDR